MKTSTEEKPSINHQFRSLLRIIIQPKLNLIFKILTFQYNFHLILTLLTFSTQIQDQAANISWYCSICPRLFQRIYDISGRIKSLRQQNGLKYDVKPQDIHSNIFGLCTGTCSVGLGSPVLGLAGLGLQELMSLGWGHYGDLIYMILSANK